MLYSFARVSAVIAMRKQDYFRQESRGWLRLHEKGGKRHDVPAHHRAAEALDDYLEAAELGVKVRRYAPPPLRGAGNLDAGSAHALRLVPCLTMPNHDPLHVVVDDLSSFRQSEATVDSQSAAAPPGRAP